ncbi:hypothetical protein OKA05_08245 [Luteolibacter arcticus]|uniref:Uncharacterized protein n=1 Tax=Luteolibacter arcticus TaxID=1581411 RepID=A0ABT3GFZ5_9BACT|nr:hypothetical protein [Luteolibacter arcticus]MCW1922542.1 hypothetical protein [Luteolibacter arcticus]
MKTPETRPRFQSANRHYHRFRSDNRGWDEWIDPARKPGSSRRMLWIAATVVLATASVVVLLFAFNVL